MKINLFVISLIFFISSHCVAGRSSLESTLMNCLSSYHQFNQYGMCSYVDEDEGYAVLKSLGDDSQFLLLPTLKITGLEDKRLMNSNTPSLFYSAWKSRAFTMERNFIRTKIRTLKESDISLSVNPVNQRSQDYFHIHISCLAPYVKKTLEHLPFNNSMTSDWSPVVFESKTGPLYYQVHRLTSASFKKVNIFNLIHDKWGDDIRFSTITVAKAEDGDFLILVRKGDEKNPAGADELHDPGCDIANPESVSVLTPELSFINKSHNSFLSRSAYYRLNSLDVTVPVYRNMTNGDMVKINWIRSGKNYSSESQKVSTLEPMHFSLPRNAIIDSIGQELKFNFSVLNADKNGEVFSEYRSLRVESQNLDLQAPSIDKSFHSVEVSYDKMKPNQTIILRLTDGVQTYSYSKPGNQDGKIQFILPEETVKNLMGKEVEINFSVSDPQDFALQFSKFLKVIFNHNEISNLLPQINEASGNDGKLLLRKDYYRLTELKIKIPPYRGMKAGDQIKLRWDAEDDSFITPAQPVLNDDGVEFSVPRRVFINAIGCTARVSFEVKMVSDNQSLSSAVLPLFIESQELNLDSPVLSGDSKKVSVAYEGMSVAHSVTLSLDGISKFKTEPQLGSDSGKIEFNIPVQWIQENRGKLVYINYAVKTSNFSEYQFSRYLKTTL